MASDVADVVHEFSTLRPDHMLNISEVRCGSVCCIRSICFCLLTSSFPTGELRVTSAPPLVSVDARSSPVSCERYASYALLIISSHSQLPLSQHRRRSCQGVKACKNLDGQMDVFMEWLLLSLAYVAD